jgi:uncharacterized membrane protein HdeD (DUF308 family)
MIYGKISTECCEKHRRYDGLKMLILGALILFNAKSGFVSWPIFIGWLVAIAGFFKLFMPKTACK